MLYLNGVFVANWTSIDKRCNIILTLNIEFRNVIPITDLMGFIDKDPFKLYRFQLFSYTKVHNTKQYFTYDSIYLVGIKLVRVSWPKGYIPFLNTNYVMPQQPTATRDYVFDQQCHHNVGEHQEHGADILKQSRWFEEGEEESRGYSKRNAAKRG